MVVRVRLSAQGSDRSRQAAGRVAKNIRHADLQEPGRSRRASRPDLVRVPLYRSSDDVRGGNELAFMVNRASTASQLPRARTAPPWRLAVPWKTRLQARSSDRGFHFNGQAAAFSVSGRSCRPGNTSFWANVNPRKSHTRAGARRANAISAPASAFRRSRGTAMATMSPRCTPT